MADKKTMASFDELVARLRGEVVVIDSWHHSRPTEGRPACQCIGPFGTVNIKLEPRVPEAQPVCDQLRALHHADYLAVIWHDEAGIINCEPTTADRKFIRSSAFVDTGSPAQEHTNG